MLLLEEKKREYWGDGGRVGTEEDPGRQASHAAPGIHLDPPHHHHHHPHPLLLSSKGHGATQPHILITDEPPLWPRTVGYNMALRHRHAACHLPSLSTVIMEETLQDAVLDRPPETF